MQVNKSRLWVGNITFLLVIVLILGMIVAGAMQYSASRQRNRMESEAKANLHEIQLSVERFSVDTDGCYPTYLIGGEPGASGVELASDPLLRKGYLTAYPRNPFEHQQYGGMSVLQMQQRLPFSYYGGDPLSPGCEECGRYGYRFGKDGSLMGQVLSDARWLAWQHEDSATGKLMEHPTWADVEYRFWDMWTDENSRKLSKPFSHGQG